MPGAGSYDVARPLSDPRQMLCGATDLERLVETAERGAHVMVLGPRGSGRSTLLHCAATRLDEEQQRTYWWRPSIEDLANERQTARSLLSAIVEGSPVALHDPLLYRWRERVWLRGMPPVQLGELSSGLLLAQPDCPIDQHVLIADLRRLREMGGHDAPLILVDDAESLCEDAPMVERILDAFDASGWRLVATSHPAAPALLRQGTSSALRRIEFLLMQRPNLDEVRQLLTDGDSYSHLLPGEGRNPWDLAYQVHNDLAYQVHKMTSSRPLLVKLVGRALAEEAETTGGVMEVSVSSLKRAMKLLWQVSRNAGQLLRLERLTRAQLKQAIQYVPLHHMSVPQIAVCRRLRILEDRFPKLSLDTDLSASEEEVAEVENHLAVLEELGVLKRVEDEDRFELVGGITAAVFFEAAARELEPESAGEFGTPLRFDDLVGAALVYSLVAAAVDDAGGGSFVGELVAGHSEAGLAEVIDSIRKRPDAVSELVLKPAQANGEEVLASFIEDQKPVLLVAATLHSAAGLFEAALLWRLEGADEAAVAEALFRYSATAEVALGGVGYRWGGAATASLSAPEGALAVRAMEPAAALNLTVSAYRDDDQDAALKHAEANAAAFERFGPSQFYGGHFAAEALNQFGFLALLRGRFDEAQASFVKAQERNQRWLFRWNLALAAIAVGDESAAAAALEDVERLASEEPSGKYHMLAYVLGEFVCFDFEPETAEDVQRLASMQRQIAATTSRDVVTAIADAWLTDDAVAATPLATVVRDHLSHSQEPAS